MAEPIHLITGIPDVAAIVIDPPYAGIEDTEAFAIPRSAPIRHDGDVTGLSKAVLERAIGEQDGSYRYVTEGLAVDWWSVVSQGWVNTGIF